MANLKVSIRGNEKPIIFDTDMGVDDARALAVLLHYSSKVKVIAITLCCSHADLNKTLMNVMRVLKEWGAINIPVFPCQIEGFDGKPIEISTEFGKDGFGEVFEADKKTVSQKYAQKENAVKAILELVKKYPEKLTYITTGPVTNLALALKQDPYTVFCLKEIIITGPCSTGMQAEEESNFYADPEAIDYILKSKLPFTFVSKDLTEVKFSLEWYDKWLEKNTKKAAFLKKIGLFNRNQLQDSISLCPEIAASICIDPDIILDTSTIKAAVELSTEHQGHMEVIEEEEDCEINKILQIDSNRVTAVLDEIVKAD